jgi:hypothetical protein
MLSARQTELKARAQPPFATAAGRFASVPCPASLRRVLAAFTPTAER